MIDLLMEALLESLLRAGALLFSWRFYLCVIIGAIVFGAILLLTPEFPFRMLAAIGSAIVCVVIGIVWEWRG